MKTTLLQVMLILTTGIVSAQSQDVVTVKPGQELSKVIPRQDQYHYSSFLQGQLYFPQGARSELLQMNYNILYGAVQFIDGAGDTLYIAEESNIFKYIRIGKDLYFHDFEQGYFVLLSREGPVKLSYQISWQIIQRDALGTNGYGTMSPSIGSEATIHRGDIRNFGKNETLRYSKEKVYYLIGARDKLFHATKSGFVKAFPEQRESIQFYIKENNIDFSRGADLKKLVEYCNTAQNISTGTIGTISYTPE